MERLSTSQVTAKLDPRNRNKGTDRGRKFIKESIQKLTFFRPAFAAADGTIIGGNHAIAAARELKMPEPIFIHSDGSRPIIHVLDNVPNADCAQARLMSAADNRASQLNQNIDTEGVRVDVEEAGAQYEDVGYTAEEIAVEVEEAEVVEEDDDRTEAEVNTPSRPAAPDPAPPAPVPPVSAGAAAGEKKAPPPELHETYLVMVDFDNQADQKACYEILRKHGYNPRLQRLG